MLPKLKKEFPAIEEIQFLYRRLRSNAHTREESLEELFKWDEQYALSYEEQMLHRFALGDVLAERRELTGDMSILTREAADELIRLHPKLKKEFLAERDRILRSENFGSDGFDLPWEEYRAAWQSGDVYALTLQGDLPGLFGAEGKVLLLLAQGEKREAEGYWDELVYLSICEEDRLPQSWEELLALGFLPGFTLAGEYQYLFALRFRREEELKALKLRKLGSFPGEYRPLREHTPRERDAVILLPGTARKNETPLLRGACYAYQRFGNIATPEQARNACNDWNYGGNSRLAAGMPKSDVTVLSNPAGDREYRTYFTHHSNLLERIPQKTVSPAED